MVALCAPLGLTTCVLPYSNGRFPPATHPPFRHIPTEAHQSRRIGAESNERGAQSVTGIVRTGRDGAGAAEAHPANSRRRRRHPSSPGDHARQRHESNGLGSKGVNKGDGRVRAYEGEGWGRERGRIWAAERGAPFSYGSECGGKESTGEIGCRWQGTTRAALVSQSQCSTTTTVPTERA